MASHGIHILFNEQAHEPAPGHPENVTRLHPVAEMLERKVVEGAYKYLPVVPHDPTIITEVHSGRYIETLRQACEAGGKYLEPDTYVARSSCDAAIAVVNAALSAIDEAIAGRIPRSFILGRPPGHHAEFGHAMGFCLINTVAIAAQYALSRHKLAKVAVIDFDVHHGNGTQHLFYDRKDVYFISTHQYPFYPGTGAASETGEGPGKGFTLNVPLAAGSGDTEIIQAFEQQVLPGLERYRPELLLVSAGFDAHRMDPLGGLVVTGAGFRRIGEYLRQAANTHCEGRVVSVLEGGYNPQGNLDAITQYIEGLETT